jgi:pimeloyl-ACP methyl ester carboxylesterase
MRWHSYIRRRLSAGRESRARRAYSARRIASLARVVARAMATTGVLGAGLAIAGPIGSASAYDLPVSFQHIKNINDSGVPCESDGADYTVRGHLTGPRSTLTGPKGAEITLYLYGFDAGEWNWRFTAVPGYNFPAEMAAKGHVSLTIDMLGYGASGYPNGFQSCIGSQAAVTHQLVQRLRNHEYTVDKPGVAPISFQKVALVGHDVGGAVAQIEAYSYKDIDALVVMTFADQGFTPFVEEIFAKRSLVCAQGGEDAKPGGPGGYILFGPPDTEFREKLFFNAEEAVIDATLAQRERNPCGYLSSVLTVLTVDQARLPEVQAPVLLIYGEEDPVLTRQGQDEQQSHFSGSSDKTTVHLANTGHFPMLERTVPVLRKVVSEWLCHRGLVAIPCT